MPRLNLPHLKLNFNPRKIRGIVSKGNCSFSIHQGRSLTGPSIAGRIPRANISAFAHLSTSLLSSSDIAK
jgi:hypothetical protein